MLTTPDFTAQQHLPTSTLAARLGLPTPCSACSSLSMRSYLLPVTLRPFARQSSLRLSTLVPSLPGLSPKPAV
eukprot:8958-Heterococcus_DN1.PRE.1